MTPDITRRDFLNRSGKVAALGAAASILPSGRLTAAAGGPIKIGQIGTGHGHAAGKLKVYRESKQFEVVGIVEPDEKLRKAAEARETYRGVPWMTREELLNVSGLQAVAVETRVPDLLENAHVCVDAGMHVHLDKPAGASLPEFGKLLANADQKKLVIQMGYMYRYNPAVVRMMQIIRQGWIGQPFEVHAVMSKVVRGDSRRRLGTYSGGMMFELGCHLIDLALGVLGTPEAVTPYKRPVLGDGLEDNTLAVLEYPKALATIRSTGNEVNGFERRHFVVCGTEGTAHIQPLDKPSLRVAVDRDRQGYEKGYQELSFGPYPRYVKDAVDFAKIIRGDKESDYPSRFDFDVQKTVLEASGMPVD